MNTVKVHFLGAAGTVTGSKFYIETPEIDLMIDCGMFQGLKELRQKNWQPLPIDVTKVHRVLLTHGHLDHTGYLPKLYSEGFRGTIEGTAPTLAITRIILRDSAKIQEEEAERANKEGYSKHRPALPLYTAEEAEHTLDLMQEKEAGAWHEYSNNIRYRFRHVGHIIGATFIELDLFGKRYVFSGDVGRTDDLLLAAPEKPEWADFLFMESTYGNRLHPEEDVEQLLTDLIRDTIRDRGTLIIPSFAVERLQSLMYLLWKLYQRNRIPNIPIFIDSPMGNNVLEVFSNYPEWHDLSIQEYHAMCDRMNLVSSYKETWETIDDPRPKVVIAGSGMVTGGRVLTYMKQLIDEPTTRILLVGYQAEGTRGRSLLDGESPIRFFGKYYPVKAAVYHIQSLSAHADQSELLNWVSQIKNIPEKTFLIHGDQEAAEGLAEKITQDHNWKVIIPSLFETHSFIAHTSENPGQN